MTAGPTILLIEDSETARSFLFRLFAKAMPEATLVEASDGKAALLELARSRPDLVVTGPQMPGTDGAAFLARLRSDPLLKKKSVIVLGAGAAPDLLAPREGEAILAAARRLLLLRDPS